MTSTGVFGRVSEFIAENETFNAYVERMEMLLTANNIVEKTGEGNTQAKGNIVRWILGRVVKVCGPRTYSVKTGHKTR